MILKFKLEVDKIHEKKAKHDSTQAAGSITLVSQL